MFKTFSIFAIVGFLIGLVATPVFAETPGQSDQAKETRVADAEALGAAFAGSEAKTDRSPRR